MRSFRPAYAWRHAAAVLIGLVVVVPVAVGGVVQLAAVPAVAASVPSCAARQLSAAGMWGGATSFQAGGAYLTNWGARECSLQGYPTVILRSGGKQLDVATIKSHATLLPGAMKSSPEVILPPGTIRVRRRHARVAELVQRGPRALWDQLAPAKRPAPQRGRSARAGHAPGGAKLPRPHHALEGSRGPRAGADSVHGLEPGRSRPEPTCQDRWLLGGASGDRLLLR
jgi:hypothetical protein